MGRMVWVVVEVRREVARGAEERTRRIVVIVLRVLIDVIGRFVDGFLQFRMIFVVMEDLDAELGYRTKR